MKIVYSLPDSNNLRIVLCLEVQTRFTKKRNKIETVIDAENDASLKV